MKKRFHSETESDEEMPEEAPSRRLRPSAAAQAHASDEEPTSSSGGSSGSDSDSSGDELDDDLDEQERVLEERLADIPFEVLEQLHQDGKGPTPAAARAAAIAAKKQVFHRDNKNRPQEVTSKRPVSRFREVIQVPKQPSKDPRFESTIGGKPFNRDAFSKRYDFLYNEVLPQERAALKDELKKTKSDAKRREIQAQLTRLQQQLSEEQARRRTMDVESSWKSEEKAAVAAGKKPFYLKASEKRKRELVAKYEELKAAGRLDKYMEKRRKKNAAKDHRYLPSQRRPGTE